MPVKQLRNGKSSNVLIVVNKELRTWEDALADLQLYFDIELKQANPRPTFQIGLIGVGRYIRFYRRKWSGIQDYPDTNSKLYGCKDDRVKIQDIIWRIIGESK